MTLLDLQNDFYRPLWIRILLLCILFVWSLFEFSTGAPFWGVLFGGIGIVAVWQWFFDDWPKSDESLNTHSHASNSDSSNKAASNNTASNSATGNSTAENSTEDGGK